MEAHFNEFLGRHYFDLEPITTTLKQYGWYQLIANRAHYIRITEKPNYLTTAAMIIQPIQYKLKELTEPDEKKRLEDALGELFRNMIADLCEHKLGFHNQFPQLVQGIREIYDANGDDFSALDELIGFNRFLENLKEAEPISLTRHLDWVHERITLCHVDECMKEYGLITKDSNFEDLFRIEQNRRVSIPAKYLKRFTLIIGEFCQGGMIKSIGGKSKYKFIQENVHVIGRGKPISNNYMKQTVDNFNKFGIGEKKHKESINAFIGDIHQKSML